MSQYVDLEAECSDDAGECMQSETEEDRAFIDDNVQEDYSPMPMDLFDSNDDVIAPKKPNKVGQGLVDGFDYGTYESKRKPSSVGGSAEPAKKPVKKAAPKIDVPTLKREPFPLAIARPICSSATPTQGPKRVKLSKTLKRRRNNNF